MSGINVNRLKKEALESCTNRGHDMKKFVRIKRSWNGVNHPEFDSWYSDCKNCGMRVIVNPVPSPNQIDIGGEAVALNCRNPE